VHEYIGCKIDINKNESTLQITQPVLLQSFVDEFKLPKSNPVTPAAAGETLHADEEVKLLDDAGHSKYQSGVGKLLHLAKWSRVEMLNWVRKLSRFMSKPNVLH
jgi:hypothetical protein